MEIMSLNERNKMQFRITNNELNLQGITVSTSN